MTLLVALGKSLYCEILSCWVPILDLIKFISLLKLETRQRCPLILLDPIKIVKLPHCKPLVLWIKDAGGSVDVLKLEIGPDCKLPPERIENCYNIKSQKQIVNFNHGIANQHEFGSECKRLVVRNCTIDANHCGYGLDELVALELNGTSPSAYQFVETLFKKPNKIATLRVLNFYGVMFTPGSSLQLESLSALLRLDTVVIPSVDVNKFFNKILSTCKKLKHFSVTVGIRSISSAVVKLEAYHPELEFLFINDMRMFPCIEETAALQIANCCPSLRTFAILANQLSLFRSESLLTLMKACPQLDWFDHCSSLSYRHGEYLAPGDLIDFPLRYDYHAGTGHLFQMRDIEVGLFTSLYRQYLQSTAYLWLSSCSCSRESASQLLKSAPKLYNLAVSRCEVDIEWFLEYLGVTEQEYQQPPSEWTRQMTSALLDELREDSQLYLLSSVARKVNGSLKHLSICLSRHHAARYFHVLDICSHTVEFTFRSVMSFRLIETALLRFRVVTFLYIDHTEINDQQLQWIGSTCKQLQGIALDACQKITSAGVCLFLQHNLPLQTLEVLECGVDDKVCDSIVKHAHLSLQELIFISLATMQLKEITKVLRHCSNLRLLVIQNCRFDRGKDEDDYNFLIGSYGVLHDRFVSLCNL